MVILTFQKPDNIVQLESNEFYGKFELKPLEPGFGVTIGNALRRILLSSLEGFAITHVKIEGINHEFSTIDGVVEDVVDIIMNLKQVRFKQVDSDVNEEIATIIIKDKEVLKAGDFNNYLTKFHVINTDLEICHLALPLKFTMEITIQKGRGYLLVEEHSNIRDLPIGTIALDAIFTPIKKVNYWVDNYRVEQKTDYEKLQIEVVTDGSIEPKNALSEAAKILIQHFLLFTNEKYAIEIDEKVDSELIDDNDSYIKQLMKTKLADLDLSVRALNCLKSANIITLGDLVSYNKSDLLKFRNFGKKSLAEIEELLKSKNLYFGMDVTKYNIE